MIVLVKLYPAYGMKRFWNEIESNRKEFYWENVTPIFATRPEGKGFIGVVVETDALDLIYDVFLKKVKEFSTLQKTETVTMMSPVFFPTREGVEYTLERYIATMKVRPSCYNKAYKKILNTKFSGDTYAEWMTYSMGAEDIILSVFSENRESTMEFLQKNFGLVDCIESVNARRMVSFMPFLSKESFEKSKDPFIYSKPPGGKGEFVNPDIHNSYFSKESRTIVLVRLFAKRNAEKLWTEIEENMGELSAEGVTPMYATYAEAKSHVSVVFETTNFENLKNFIVKNIPLLENVRETQTVLLSNPHYYDLPAGHPTDLHRYLITLSADPERVSHIRKEMEKASIPSKTFLTFSSFCMGEQDIFLSILADSRDTVQDFAAKTLDDMSGVRYYDISSQTHVIPLAPEGVRNEHKQRYFRNLD